MARSNWGITSGFIGKLGNVVGFNWKGINIQRALIHGSDRRSEAQLLQRARFKMIGHTASVLYDAVYEGFRMEARSRKGTQSGLFLKNNSAALSGDTPDTLVFDYGALQLSEGPLRPVMFGTPSLSGTVLTATISDGGVTGRRVSPTDRVYLCAYCPALDEAVCSVAGNRNSKTLTLTVPASFAAQEVHVYGFTVGASQSNEGLASATTYLGTVGSGSSTSGGNTGGNSGTTGGGDNTGGNNGGSSQTETVTAPTISGTSPFTETTQVTITGPSEAEIRYTTDGSTPTAESSLYSSALTLSDTTVVKAIAIKNGVSSTVASQTFTKGEGSGEGYGDTN